MPKPKVGGIGEAIMRGDANNFYIRCGDDLDDQDEFPNSIRANEYPHLHFVTTGPLRNDDITYIGITFNGAQPAIDIFRNGQHCVSIHNVKLLIATHLTLIPGDRVAPLANYIFGYTKNDPFEGS